MEKGKKIIDEYLDGQPTKEEVVKVESWYIKYTRTKTDQLPESDYDRVKTEIWNRIKPKPIHRLRLWYRVAAAAAISMMIFGAGLYYFNVRTRSPITETTYTSDVAPGQQGATLTLSNGKKIHLNDASNGELAKEAGVKITKSTSGNLVYTMSGQEADENKINTLSTSAGETYQVQLPDGSNIWLNAQSTLTYSSKLIRNNIRSVRLDGEAYFEIAKVPDHPFIVETKRQKIEVLGTHFNVNSYQNEAMARTTLLEGSVRLNQQHILRPGEQGITTTIGNTQISQANTEETLAWKNGYFRFNDEKIESIMKKLERWYNVRVEYESQVPNIGFNGTISRNNNISRVLRLLETTKAVHFKIEGRRIIVGK